MTADTQQTADTVPAWLMVHEGNAPLICSIPHAGFMLPEALRDDFVSEWDAQRDCDWWVDRLYDFARELDATVVCTGISRSVIDVNRPADGQSLYPGQATTGLCPTTNFDGDPLYRDGREPDAAEIERRKRLYYWPYHGMLERHIRRLRAQYPAVVLYDCHSIRSNIPRLFDAQLPVMNLGTNDGRSCDVELQALAAEVCQESPFSWVLNGRFKGGAITRMYGNPASGVHAFQMELACRGYMREPSTQPVPGQWPSPWSEQDAAKIRKTLKTLLSEMKAWAVRQTMKY